VHPADLLQKKGRGWWQLNRPIADEWATNGESSDAFLTAKGGGIRPPVPDKRL